MDHRVTQCPRCGTSFRVTEAHLAVAAGAVRCGSCLHIFNARDHWADEAQATPAPAEEAKPKPIPPKTQRGSSGGAGAAAAAAAKPAVEDIGDDVLIDDNTPLFDDDDEEDEKPAKGSIFNPEEDDFAELEQSGPERLSDEINSWEEDTSHSFKDINEPDPAAPDHESDEQWTRRLLEEEEEEQEKLIKGSPARSSIFEDYGNILDEARATGDDGAPEEEVIILDLPDAQPADQRRAAPAREPEDELPPEIETIDLSMTPLRADDRIGDEGGRPLFNNFEAEPLQLHQFVRESRWPKIAWGGGLLLALLLFVGQYLYFNFDTLGRGELRPYLAQVCSVFNCTLPTLSDPARIRTSSLIVRSHPTHKGALAVDAIITNQAPFPQPYPSLQLQFTDLNGAPVAGRQFRPEEYLGGELTGSRLMPVQQPVHIALELVDPGPRAVNYLLTVVANSAEPTANP